MEQHLQAIVTVWDRRAKVISKLEGEARGVPVLERVRGVNLATFAKFWATGLPPPILLRLALRRRRSREGNRRIALIDGKDGSSTPRAGRWSATARAGVRRRDCRAAAL